MSTSLPFNPLTRRTFLKSAGMTLGGTAFATLGLNRSATAHEASLNQGLHHSATAKRVISLVMSGGPSHIDTFDFKESMLKNHGTPLPDSIRGTQRLTGMTSGQKEFPVCAPIAPFKQYGHSGIYVSDLLPYMAQVVDHLTIIKSMHTEAINHDPGITFLNTCSQFPGRPSMGAWSSYGLGSMNQNMPAYIVLLSQGTGKNPGQPIFSRLWANGFLPSSHQGVQLRSSGDPVLYLNDPKGYSREERRTMLDGLASLNQIHLDETGDLEIQTRITQYEMAYRMQVAAPELADLSNEPEHIFQMYGPDSRKPGTYAWNCILARRMAERDVRFIQLFHRGWDQHSELQTHLPNQCRDTDQPTAALITDLKQRGLLDETLVTWGGEFGRTAYSQGKLGTGRDHHGRCFSSWMAGGGIKGGHTYGITDDFCYNIVDNPVHIRDFNATMLHCMGIDHERLSVKFQGLRQTPTGVEETHVIKDILA
jgi:hypothetical protein